MPYAARAHCFRPVEIFSPLWNNIWIADCDQKNGNQAFHDITLLFLLRSVHHRPDEKRRMGFAINQHIHKGTV